MRTPHRVRRHLEGDHVGRLEHYFPDVDERGLYKLGDPSVGKEHHHKKNAIFVETFEAARHLISTYGFSLRMRGDLTKQRNLIVASEIRDL